MYDHRVASGMKRWASRQTGGLDPAVLRSLTGFLAAVHDVGKASPTFAYQVDPSTQAVTWLQAPVLIERLRTNGFQPAPQHDKIRHELVSALAVEAWLENAGATPEATEALLSVVGSHHRRGLDHATLDDAYLRPHLTGRQPGTNWASVQDELIGWAADLYLTSEATAALRDPSLRWPRAVLNRMTGWLVAADHAASNEWAYPHLPNSAPPVQLNEEERVERARVGWRKLALPHQWQPAKVTASVADLFAARFRIAEPRAVQVAAVEEAAVMDAHGLLMIEATTGVGKTEGSLAAAEVLMNRSGATGVLVALPTQATTDAMFSRVVDWLERTDGTKDVYLAHGQADLNERYATLKVAGERPGNVTANWWVNALRQRRMLAGSVVSTIDNILAMAVNSRAVPLSHAGIADKVVIIDEVHAYDAHMSQYLFRALEWLGAYATPVILMTATLAPSQRERLWRAYHQGRAWALNREVTSAPTSWPAIGYPAVISTGTDGEPRVWNAPSTGQDVGVTVELLADDMGTLVNALRAELADGGNAVVIRNTVARAQKTARALRAAFPDVEVTLVHARFTAFDRRRNDQRLLSLFSNAPDAQRPHRHIVVATQVVEQSLDVDFDVMFTDIAPSDLLLQRFGRLHRHKRTGRPIRTPKCYITGVDWSGPVPTFARGLTHVYSEYLLLRTLAVLHERQHLAGSPIRIPSDVPGLVADVYDGDEELGPDEWADALDRTREAAAKVTKKSVAAANQHRLPGPCSEDSLVGFQQLLSRDGADDTGSKVAVREGVDAIEALLVVRNRFGALTIPNWADGECAGALIPRDDVPDEIAQAVRQCRMRLPAELSDERYVKRFTRALEDETPAGWQRSPTLRGHLALVVSEGDLRAEFALGKQVVTLTYDPVEGLTKSWRTLAASSAA